MNVTFLDVFTLCVFIFPVGKKNRNLTTAESNQTLHEKVRALKILQIEDK